MDHVSASPGLRVSYPAAFDVQRAAILVALCMALFLPGFFSLPPIDRDEARFAQATKQMIETGDYVDIRFQDEARHKKPVGIYWLQAVVVKASGAGAEAPIWVYRLPSLLGATAAVLALLWAGAPLFGASVAMLAAVILASSILLGVEARLAKTDAVMLLTVILATGALARAYVDVITDRWRTPLIFWTAIAAGVLIKGPLILLVVGLTIATLCIVKRDARWLLPLRPVSGSLFALLLILPWFIAITLQSDGAFFREAVGHDLLGKVTKGQESHGAPPGTYFAIYWATFWPWAPLSALAVPWIWRSRTNPAVTFCLAWTIPCWLVFELVPTKLPHYVLPLYPAIALLLAKAIEGHALRLRHYSAWAALIAVPLVAAIVAGGVSGLLWYVEGRISPVGIVLGLGSVGLLILGMRFLRQEMTRTIAAIVGGAALLYFTVFQILFPALDSVWISPRLSEAVDRANACAVASTGFREPSLVFLVGTNTQLSHPQTAAAFIAADPCRVALVEKRGETAFLESLRAIGGTPVLSERVQGININGGQRLDIAVYRVGKAGQ